MEYDLREEKKKKKFLLTCMYYCGSIHLSFTFLVFFLIIQTESLDIHRHVTHKIFPCIFVRDVTFLSDRFFVPFLSYPTDQNGHFLSFL